MNKISEAKLGVAVSEIISAIYFAEHRRIISAKATYKTISVDGRDELVPDIKIILEPGSKSEE